MRASTVWAAKRFLLRDCLVLIQVVHAREISFGFGNCKFRLPDGGFGLHIAGFGFANDRALQGKERLTLFHRISKLRHHAHYAAGNRQNRMADLIRIYLDLCGRHDFIGWGVDRLDRFDRHLLELGRVRAKRDFPFRERTNGRRGCFLGSTFVVFTTAAQAHSGETTH